MPMPFARCREKQGEPRVRALLLRQAARRMGKPKACRAVQRSATAGRNQERGVVKNERGKNERGKSEQRIELRAAETRCSGVRYGDRPRGDSSRGDAPHGQKTVQRARSAKPWERQRDHARKRADAETSAVSGAVGWPGVGACPTPQPAARTRGGGPRLALEEAACRTRGGSLPH